MKGSLPGYSVHGILQGSPPKGAKDLNRHLFKNIHQWWISIWKDAQQSLGKCILKPQFHTIPLEWLLLETKPRGFPGGPMVKNLSANAEDTGSIPGPRRSHIPQSNYTFASLVHAPLLLKLVCLAPMIFNKRSPCLWQLDESLRAAMKTQHSQN